MIMKRFAMIAILFAFIASSIETVSSAGVPSIVVSTSILASAAKEVTPSKSISIVTLLTPSSCPGHFDLSPRIIPLLKTAVLSIRHDYQGEIEEKVTALGGKSMAFLKVTSPGSPLIPSNYYAIVKQIGTMYETVFPGRHNEIASLTDSVKQRTEVLSQLSLAAALPWKGCRVIAATHVAELCRWLGFDVAGVITRPEDMTPFDLQNLVKLRADMIVANLQEGVQGAESLGKNMKLPVAVLSNFPGAEGYGTDFYDLMKANLSKLDKAWRKQ
jgi:hypothetical protein